MIEQIKAKVGQSQIIYDAQRFALQNTEIVALDIETFGCDKKPGDSAYCARHGIAGIALGNLSGDSAYLVTRGANAIDLKLAVQIAGRFVQQAKMCVCHYGKFDLGFLIQAGFSWGNAKLVDTWLLSNIADRGIYKANKLKAIVREKLQIATDTEAIKDKWMEEHGTEDYGDVPPELMGTYACDDVRFSLLALLMHTGLDSEDWACHDRYIRNNLNVIAAERRGIQVHLPKMLAEMALKKVKEMDAAAEVQKHLGSAAGVDLQDEQACLKFLHVKNMHPAPRELYGELQYVFDDEYLSSIEQPLAKAYREFHGARVFREQFSVTIGAMKTRFSQAGQEVIFHPQYLQSVFSRGGLVQCRQPDFEKAALNNTIRGLFQPREGYQFVHVRARDLLVTLLSLYTNNAMLASNVEKQTQTVLGYLGETIRLKPEMCALILRKLFEGSGNEIFERRCRLAKLTFGTTSGYAVCDQFDANLFGVRDFKASVNKALRDRKYLTDRGGRKLAVPQDKLYRVCAILLQSSYGSLLSYYLDLFCKLARDFDAYLVMCHQNEFVFESAKPVEFSAAVLELVKHTPLLPKPVFEVAPGWYAANLQAHETGVRL